MSCSPPPRITAHPPPARCAGSIYTTLDDERPAWADLIQRSARVAHEARAEAQLYADLLHLSLNPRLPPDVEAECAAVGLLFGASEHAVLDALEVPVVSSWREPWVITGRLWCAGLRGRILRREVIRDLAFRWRSHILAAHALLVADRAARRWLGAPPLVFGRRGFAAAPGPALVGHDEALAAAVARVEARAAQRDELSACLRRARELARG